MSASRGSSVSPQSTVLDRLVEQLRSRDAAGDGQERPVAILWTDPKSEWLPLVELLHARLEEFLVLGPYRPEARSGPAIWLRCLVDGSLTAPALPRNRAPIVYLPGVGRQELRAGEECRPAIRPLVELMFRGAMWLQPNGSDWAVTAFLTSSKTLGLQIARDYATTEALLRALPEVALTPVEVLSDKQLQSDDFDRMLADDVIRDLLRWMADPASTYARLGPNGWAAFCARCRDELKFDPETEADVVAGEKMAKGEGPWSSVWQRFVESPGSFGDVAGVLRRSRPAGKLRFDRERWPDLNEEDEGEVRSALKTLVSLPHAEACAAILRLEEGHGTRRTWVWARIGLSPTADVLEPLSQLASSVRSCLGGTTADEFGAAYLERGWQADAASWEAMAVVSTGDERIVSDAVRHLLAPWLHDSARAFQDAINRTPLPARGKQPVVEAGDDVCVLFADGLRYDLGVRLAEKLEGRGCRVHIGRRWAALPTVTGTAKPAVTPVSDSVVGETLGEDFSATLGPDGVPADAPHLREAIRKRGYQVVGEGAFDVPMSQPARGWLEAGEIDSLGHKLGARLARQINDELSRLADRVLGLLDAGWKGVRVVTDHGWLLLPGGLSKVDLPKHLTASRWSRCAVVSGESTPDVPRLPWHWNPGQWFATAPGTACFNRAEEYAHGGVSVQECLVPDLMIERAGETAVVATIGSITWRGLRCFVEANIRGGRVTADLRLDRPSGMSVVASRKPVEADGAVSLVLAGDEFESASLVLVLLDDAEHVLSHKATRVGVDS